MQGIELTEKLQQVAGVHDAAVGTEIAGPVPDQPPRQIDFRELVRAHADPRIGLRVLQQDVVAGLVLLDQVVLQQEGVGLGVHDGELRIGDLGHQDARFRVQPFRGHEILRDPLVQVLRLPHIDDLPRGVIIPVDAGGMREKGYFFLDGHSK